MVANENAYDDEAYATAAVALHAQLQSALNALWEAGGELNDIASEVQEVLKDWCPPGGGYIASVTLHMEGGRP